MWRLMQEPGGPKEDTADYRSLSAFVSKVALACPLILLTCSAWHQDECLKHCLADRLALYVCDSAVLIGTLASSSEDLQASTALSRLLCVQEAAMSRDNVMTGLHCHTWQEACTATCTCRVLASWAFLQLRGEPEA